MTLRERDFTEGLDCEDALLKSVDLSTAHGLSASV
jgi:hypothetical protein